MVTTRRTLRNKEDNETDIKVDPLDLINKTKRLETTKKRITKENDTLKKRLAEMERMMAQMREEQEKEKKRKRSTSSSSTAHKKRHKSQSQSQTKKSHQISRSKSHTRSNRSASLAQQKPHVPTKYFKYLRMKKMGIPAPMLAQAMMRDGVEPPTTFDINAITTAEIEEILAHPKSNSASASASKTRVGGPVGLAGITQGLKLKKIEEEKKASPITHSKVKIAFDKLSREIDDFEHKEIIFNFIGFENEARKPEKKMEHIQLINNLIQSGKITKSSGKMKVLNAINSAGNLIKAK